MPRTQNPTTPKNPKLTPEHDFTQTFQSWEASVFDRSAYFSAVTLPGRERHEFTTFAEAQAYATPRRNVCLYAVTDSGRSTHLERAAWPAWLQRAEQNDG